MQNSNTVTSDHINGGPKVMLTFLTYQSLISFFDTNLALRTCVLLSVQNFCGHFETIFLYHTVSWHHSGSIDIHSRATSHAISNKKGIQEKIVLASQTRFLTKPKDARFSLRLCGTDSTRISFFSNLVQFCDN